MAKRYDGRKGIYNLDFPKMVQKGENTRDPEYGFESQTANGTGRCDYPGWNRKDETYPNQKAREGGAWSKGSNRTAE